jgi:hypothetical protein
VPNSPAAFTHSATPPISLGAIGGVAFLDEGKAGLDQCSVRAPAAGTIKVLVTLGQLVSTYAPTTLVQLTPDAKVRHRGRLTQNLDHQHPGAQHDGDEAEDLAQAFWRQPVGRSARHGALARP